VGSGVVGGCGGVWDGPRGVKIPGSGANKSEIREESGNQSQVSRVMKLWFGIEPDQGTIQ
jgi:hypothetical protein